MNKAISITLASILAGAPVGYVYAQDSAAGSGRETVTENGKTVTKDGSDPSGETTQSSTTGTESATSANGINIVLLSALEADKDQTNAAETLKLKANDPANMKKVQDELMTDQVLVDALKAENVQIQNVIDVQTSANGGKTVYVK